MTISLLAQQPNATWQKLMRSQPTTLRLAPNILLCQKQYAQYTAKMQKCPTDTLYVYLLQGELKLQEIAAQPEYHFHSGDWLKISPQTSFLQKCLPHTQLLQIQIPGTQTIQTTTPPPQWHQWLQQW